MPCHLARRLTEAPAASELLTARSSARTTDTQQIRLCCCHIARVGAQSTGPAVLFNAPAAAAVLAALGLNGVLMVRVWSGLLAQQRSDLQVPQKAQQLPSRAQHDQ